MRDKFPSLKHLSTQVEFIKEKKQTKYKFTFGLISNLVFLGLTFVCLIKESDVCTCACVRISVCIQFTLERIYMTFYLIIAETRC